MAKVGLSKPFYASYAASNGSVTYSNGGSMGKAVSVSIEPDDNDTTKFYADNGPAESAQIFSGGTLTLEIDRLDSTVLGALYRSAAGCDVHSVYAYASFLMGVKRTQPSSLSAGKKPCTLTAVYYNTLNGTASD